MDAKFYRFPEAAQKYDEQAQIQHEEQIQKQQLFEQQMAKARYVLLLKQHEVSHLQTAQNILQYSVQHKLHHTLVCRAALLFVAHFLKFNDDLHSQFLRQTAHFWQSLVFFYHNKYTRLWPEKTRPSTKRKIIPCISHALTEIQKTHSDKAFTQLKWDINSGMYHLQHHLNTFVKLIIKVFAKSTIFVSQSHCILSLFVALGVDLSPDLQLMEHLTQNIF